MTLKKVIHISLMLCLCLPLAAQAQHYNSWFRFTVHTPVHRKWDMDNEVQYRRQSRLHTTNPLDANLMQSYRLWLRYNPSKNVRLVVSPVAYFITHPTILKPSDEFNRTIREYRATAAIEAQQKLVNRTYLTGRSGLEYRAFLDFPDVLRFRNKVGLRYMTASGYTFTGYAELLNNLTGTSRAKRYDQSRYGLNIAYVVRSRVKLEVGYMHLHRLPRSIPTYITESNFLLNMSYLIGKHHPHPVSS